MLSKRCNLKLLAVLSANYAKTSITINEKNESSRITFAITIKHPKLNKTILVNKSFSN